MRLAEFLPFPEKWQYVRPLPYPMQCYSTELTSLQWRWHFPLYTTCLLATEVFSQTFYSCQNVAWRTAFPSSAKDQILLTHPAPLSRHGGVGHCFKEFYFFKKCKKNQMWIQEFIHICWYVNSKNKNKNLIFIFAIPEFLDPGETEIASVVILPVPREQFYMEIWIHKSVSWRENNLCG